MLLAGVLPMGQAAAAAATCDQPLDLEEALATSSVVFAGKVGSVDATPTQAGARVAPVWKGPELPAELGLVGGFEGEAAKRMYNTGATYLFMPSNRQAPFIDGPCSQTRFYSGPALVIPPYLAAAVGTDTARMPLGVE